MTNASAQVLTASEVRRLCGDFPDASIEAIVATGAEVADLEAAVFRNEASAGAISGPAAEIRRIIEEDGDWAAEPN